MYWTSPEYLSDLCHHIAKNAAKLPANTGRNMDLQVQANKNNIWGGYATFVHGKQMTIS